MLNDFILNLHKMTNDELQQTFDGIYELYMKYDGDEFNTVAEHFRIQIDIIENYANMQRNISMFDE